MVITCPHALGLAIPMVVAVSTSIAASSGILIRDKQAFERARNLQALIFDKTGLLTEGRFGVTDIISLSGEDNDEILSLAASLEASSEHPIAAGIFESVRKGELKIRSVEKFTVIPGKGVEGLVGGKKYLVVSPGYLAEKGIALKNEKSKRLKDRGKQSCICLRKIKLLEPSFLPISSGTNQRKKSRNCKAWG